MIGDINRKWQPKQRAIRDSNGKLHEAHFLVQTRQKEINALIQDIDLAPRQKRGLGSLICEGLAWGFDLATASDVDELRSLLQQVLDSTNKAVSAWTVGQNLITCVTKLTTSRFDKIDALLNLTRRSLIEENRRLQHFTASDYTAQRLIIIITQELGDLISQMHKVESFYLAMKDLALKLSHHLVETEILQDHLNKFMLIH